MNVCTTRECCARKKLAEILVYYMQPKTTRISSGKEVGEDLRFGSLLPPATVDNNYSLLNKLQRKWLRRCDELWEVGLSVYPVVEYYDTFYRIENNAHVFLCLLSLITHFCVCVFLVLVDQENLIALARSERKCKGHPVLKSILIFFARL